jgi:hypothetical protein
MSNAPLYQIHVTDERGLHIVDREVIGGIRGALGWSETAHVATLGKGTPDFAYKPAEPVPVADIEARIDSVIGAYPLRRMVHDMNEEL